MGSIAARKAAQVIANTANVLALELVCACQALDFHRVADASPAAGAVHTLVRENVAPLDRDRALHAEVEALGGRILDGDIAAAAQSVLAAPLG